MNRFFLSIAAASLALVSADVNFKEMHERKLAMEEDHRVMEEYLSTKSGTKSGTESGTKSGRQLDASFFQTPSPSASPSKVPTQTPSASPTTSEPSKQPTTSPSAEPSSIPSRLSEEYGGLPWPSASPSNFYEPAPKCGTIRTKDGSERLLGPLPDENYYCNGDSYAWYRRTFTHYDYEFELSQYCEYKFSSPETGSSVIMRDINHWFEQAATSLKGWDEIGYKASPDEYVFSGYAVPENDDIEYEADIADAECPLNYCIRITGPSVGLNTNEELSDGSAEPYLLYAFSSWEGYSTFEAFLSSTMYSWNAHHIFMSNHYLKCSCPSFCIDEEFYVQDFKPLATCYVEDNCGVKTFQIAYSDDYPETQRVSWENTGTTHVMEWFSECANVMHECPQLASDFNPARFSGVGHFTSIRGPDVYTYDEYESATNVYGFGGWRGFGWDYYSQPALLWQCPSPEHLERLVEFGDLISDYSFFRHDSIDTSVPETCPEPPLIEPEDPIVFDPEGPPCTEVENEGLFCFELKHATCYIRDSHECSEFEFVIEGVLDGAEGMRVTTDVEVWDSWCHFDGIGCGLPSYWDEQPPYTYENSPWAFVSWSDYQHQWLEFQSGSSGRPSAIGGGNSYRLWNCDDATQAYLARDFTDAVAASSSGDLYQVPPLDCTESPTASPSMGPTSSTQPSNSPTMSPTICGESYLNSESLNIDLAIDLSYSTYLYLFSSEVDIGDVNGDGKANTILDAQVQAIEELLVAILESETLGNRNCEINLISFHTDATNHGTFLPLSEDESSINTRLMHYIKTELRAPTSDLEVQLTNNGFTNFDAALDLAGDYFEYEATPDRLNLLVFLSDGEPNVRGDGDDEGYCADTAGVWNSNPTNGFPAEVQCADLDLEAGVRHTFCRADDPECVPRNPYQECVRGMTKCMNSPAVTQYESEINRLTELRVERLAIGVGDASNVSEGSALWMIDNNPGKDLGVLPIQALDLEALSNALKSLCILNTDPPTAEPSHQPSDQPTSSTAPSVIPTDVPSSEPTDVPSSSPTEEPEFTIETPSPTKSPTQTPTKTPTKTPTASPSQEPSTSEPTGSPTAFPTRLPSASPTSEPTTAEPSAAPSQYPSGSFYPSSAPTESPTESPAPSQSPTDAPTTSPTVSPTVSPTLSPTASPTKSPTASPTSSPTNKPTEFPTTSPTDSPTSSVAPTFLLPECYDYPKLVKKDSSDTGICFFSEDMIFIEQQNTTEVGLRINNVWSKTLPQDVILFSHSNGVNSVRGGNGFECDSEDGNAIDLAGSDEIMVQCHSEGDGEPYLAVVDLMIIDSNIPVNDVNHPCNPNEVIPNACSWRMVIPCEEDVMCTPEPTDSPSVYPTYVPTFGESTGSPTTLTTFHSESPTTGTTFHEKTESPTHDLDRHTNDDESNDIVYESECPEDIVLLEQEGVTEFPEGGLYVVGREDGTVTVKLTQTFTDATVDSLFYQYQIGRFSNKCFEDKDVPVTDSVDITILCTEHSKIALLELWVVDALEHNLLSESDNSVVPECCHPTHPEGTPATKYLFEIKCLTVCADAVE